MRRLICLFLTIHFSLSCAHLNASPVKNTIYTGEQNAEISLDEMINSLPDKGVIVFGEIHNLNTHHEKHLLFLKRLHELKAKRIHVALEFLSYPDQKFVDDYLKGELSDQDFQTATGFGSDFPSYKPKILFPLTTGGQSFAINAPRSLSRQLARVGLEGLSEEEEKLLPPDFTLGNEEYYARFLEVMTGGSHPLPPAALERYFQAQSLWDDTMAWKVSEWQSKYPNDLIVIIVGDFHASYESGLPERLRARGVNDITTISQVQFFGLNTQQRTELLSPNGPYGVRADYIWTSSERVSP